MCVLGKFSSVIMKHLHLNFFREFIYRNFLGAFFGRGQFFEMSFLKGCGVALVWSITSEWPRVMSEFMDGWMYGMYGDISKLLENKIPWHG